MTVLSAGLDRPQGLGALLDRGSSAAGTRILTPSGGVPRSAWDVDVPDRGAARIGVGHPGGILTPAPARHASGEDSLALRVAAS
ncbi:MAG TPA: hypothetical protein VG457_16610 [Planctomycetota bacterium]|nr:hypothetical protein [Planctomycetota bacterium]